MSAVGQIEKKTQQRVVKLFRETLGYGYLGNWEEREGNRNIESDLLRSWLAMIEAAKWLAFAKPWLQREQVVRATKTWQPT